MKKSIRTIGGEKKNPISTPQSPPKSCFWWGGVPRKTRKTRFFSNCAYYIYPIFVNSKRLEKNSSAENTWPYHLPKILGPTICRNTGPYHLPKILGPTYHLPKILSLLIRKRSHKFTQVDFPPTGCPIIGSNKLPLQRQTTMDKVIRSPSCEVKKKNNL